MVDMQREIASSILDVANGTVNTCIDVMKRGISLGLTVEQAIDGLELLKVNEHERERWIEAYLDKSN